MTNPTSSLLAEINLVQRLDLNQLMNRYGRFFSGGTTRCTATLRQEIIYRLQEEHYDRRIGESTTDILNASLEKRAERVKEREVIVPGTQFTRQWRNVTHVLIYRGPKQYEYDGRIYKSPSVVAKLITGTNWNGREFFRLPSLKSMKEGR